MVFGIVGIGLMLGPIVKETMSCEITNQNHIKINQTMITNSTNSTTNNTLASNNDDNDAEFYDICKSSGELALSLFYAIMAPILWGIVAGTLHINHFFHNCKLQLQIISLYLLYSTFFISLFPNTVIDNMICLYIFYN